ncbi:MAG: hypothetical protein KDK55_03270 [Chlamydiia bacterium]|nr:hypothetical protein [Chlamydiia bacterium]
MKCFFVSILLLISVFLAAEEESSPPPPIASADANFVLPEDFSFFPISIEGGYLAMHRAGFRTNDVKGEHIRFTQAEASFGFILPLDLTWGLIFGAGWVNNEVNMSNNPQFTETNFGYATGSLGVFTRNDDWMWTVMFNINIDTDELDLGNYALYDGILWGKYTLCPYLDFTFGFIVEVGLNKDKAWPIIGLSYEPCDKWKINSIYPTDIGVEYELFPCLTTTGAVRFLRSRHRVGPNEVNSRGIFQYQAVGTEFDLTYKPFEWFWIQGYLGHCFGGDFKVTNSADKHGIHYKFSGSLYGGGAAELKF